MWVTYPGEPEPLRCASVALQDGQRRIVEHRAVLDSICVKVESGADQCDCGIVVDTAMDIAPNVPPRNACSGPLRNCASCSIAPALA